MAKVRLAVTIAADAGTPFTGSELEKALGRLRHELDLTSFTNEGRGLRVQSASERAVTFEEIEMEVDW